MYPDSKNWFPAHVNDYNCCCTCKTDNETAFHLIMSDVHCELWVSCGEASCCLTATLSGAGQSAPSCQRMCENQDGMPLQRTLSSVSPHQLRTLDPLYFPHTVKKDVHSYGVLAHLSLNLEKNILFEIIFVNKWISYDGNPLMTLNC